MQYPNNQVLVHAGIDLIVAGALFFWFQTKISQLQRENGELKKNIEELRNIVLQHQQVLQYHGSLIVPQRKPPVKERDLDDILQEEIKAIEESRDEMEQEFDEEEI